MKKKHLFYSIISILIFIIFISTIIYDLFIKDINNSINIYLFISYIIPAIIADKYNWTS